MTAAAAAGWMALSWPGSIGVTAPGDVGGTLGGFDRSPETLLDGALIRERLPWMNSIDNALGMASEEYRPVVIFFHSPSCGWCGRMKGQVLTDDAVVEQLEHFLRVEVVVEDNPDRARQYLVSGVPAIRILSADGRVQRGADGFVTAPQMVQLLRSALNTEFLKETDADFRNLVAALEKGEVESSRWPEVLLSLGEREKREALRDLILEMKPFPAGDLVARLDDARLAVRLGALELLEEVAGDNFGFDPWAGSISTPGNRVALEQWREWAGKSVEEGVKAVFSVLDEKQLAGYIRDLAGDDRERSIRAASMLRNGGDNVAASLERFLDLNPELPTGARQQVREMYFALAMPPVGDHDPDALAHRLVFGNLDAKLETLTVLKDAGPAALPVLRAFLDDADSLVRETSVDGILAAGRQRSLGTVEDHLQGERDSDVILAALRGIGAYEVRGGEKILVKFLEDRPEDETIIALESLGALRAKDRIDAIAKRLEDERWRVRVAALEAVAKLREVSKHAPKVRALLEDEDGFVQAAAVETIAAIGDKQAAPELRRLFERDDALKAPVVAALIKLELELPERLAENLKSSDADSQLAVLEALSKGGAKYLDTVEGFAGNANLDVAASAIRTLARYGLGQSRYQALIASLLEERDPVKTLAALESIKLEPHQFARYRPEGASEAESVGPSNPLVEETYRAFLHRGNPAPPEAGSSTMPTDPLGALFTAVKGFLVPANPAELREAAALLLARAGDPGALGFLEQALAERTAQQRAEIAESLEEAPGAVLPLLKMMLRDEAEQVRKAAAIAMLEHEKEPEFMETLLQEVYRIGTRMKPWEVSPRYLDGPLEQPMIKAQSSVWASQVLEQSTDPAMRILALVILRHAWDFQSEDLVLASAKESEDPLERRAAWFAIGRNRKDLLEQEIDQLAKDPSPRVRAVIPFIFDEQGRSWNHYFTEEEMVQDYDYGRFSFSSRSAPRLAPEVTTILLAMLDDSAANLQVDAAFVLLAHGEEVDPNRLTEILSGFPDRESIRLRVSDYLEEHYQKLDRGYASLLAHVDPNRIDAETLPRIYQHFGVANSGEGDTLELNKWKRGSSGRADSPPEGGALADQPIGSRAGESDGPGRVELLFFHNPGCEECDRVEDFIEEIGSMFPRLDVNRLNIRLTDSAKLNEALSERFGVPEKIRLVTPAVFTADGYLIKDDISPVSLGDLVARSARTGDSQPGWASLGETESEAAGAAIEQRFSGVGLAVILSAGLLDGINPCAFATIILFLSYLQVARHGARQILVVGFAFILGVFLTYFALGIGLVEVVTRLQFLKGIGLALNWGLALFALVIMMLSLRDGVLCLQGRLADTSLQLPGFLKDRIRQVVRTGTRHRRFVIAAFASGVIISVLELACTGQVYLPTIYYMVQQGKASAVGYLLFYNLAFILPLLVIFGLTFYGLRSDALVRFQQKHSASVKFATAALFLALFLLLLWQLLR